MSNKPLSKLIPLIAALTLTDGAFFAYLNVIGKTSMAESLGYLMIAVATILSIVVVVLNHKLWVPSILTVLALLFLVWFQGKHDVFGSSEEFTRPFIVHGIGGFLMGASICDYKRFTKYLGFISSIYLIVLISEPINRTILQGDSMSTGYFLTTYIVFVILAYFTVSNHNKFYLFLSVLMSFLVLFFTSRGCGMTLALTWFFFYLREKRLRGENILRSIMVVGAVSVVFILLLPFISNSIIHSNLSFDEGSLVGKMALHTANDSNGRDEIWDVGIAAIGEYWMTGMGFGADRAVTYDSSFVHNIIMELFIDFGLPLSLIILYLYWNPIIKSIKNRFFVLSTAVVVSFAIRSWGQLMVSSSYLMNMLTLMFVFGLATRLNIDNKSKSEAY